MKAITIWQPWAHLIIRGEKTIETRSWSTRVRGTIAIHAAKKDCLKNINALSQKEKDFFYNAQKYNDYNNEICFPLGVIIGTIDLVGCQKIEELLVTEYATVKEKMLGDWSENRYGWILEKPCLFEKPIPYNGHQGFWNWNK
jgi:hypothetical protein